MQRCALQRGVLQRCVMRIHWQSSSSGSVVPQTRVASLLIGTERVAESATTELA
jgi:hypothetical protein